MGFNVLPFGTRPTADSASATDSAEIVDLASRRETAVDVPEIPDHVWDEVEAASQLWHELRADDREVRFDTDAATGRMVASLREVDGGVVRALPLRSVLGVDDDGPQTAA
jgi:hypothetical protein